MYSIYDNFVYSMFYIRRELFVSIHTTMSNILWSLERIFMSNVWPFRKTMAPMYSTALIYAIIARVIKQEKKALEAEKAVLPGATTSTKRFKG